MSSQVKAHTYSGIQPSPVKAFEITKKKKTQTKKLLHKCLCSRSRTSTMLGAEETLPSDTQYPLGQSIPAGRALHSMNVRLSRQLHLLFRVTILVRPTQTVYTQGGKEKTLPNCRIYKQIIWNTGRSEKLLKPLEGVVATYMGPVYCTVVIAPELIWPPH